MRVTIKYIFIGDLMKKIFFLAAIACFAYNVNAETANEAYDNFKLEIVDGVIQEGKYSDNDKIYELIMQDLHILPDSLYLIPKVFFL